MSEELPFDAARERLPTDLDRVEWAIVALVVVALAARLVGLGARVAHYDEGWVGYWTLRYLRTGQWTYRPIVHGPFLVHVNALVFRLVGASDRAARLVVALLGGLLPATAVLFRARLRDGEVVALAALLAANPLLLYYSRFARFDLPLAAFALATLGLLVRLADTGHRRYAYGAAVTAALAVTTKESWLLYVLAWLGAGVLLADERLLAARHRDEAPQAVLRGWARRAAAVVGERAHHVARSMLLFLAVTVFFYAPRPALWRIPTAPALVLVVFDEATVGVIAKLVGRWVGGMQGHPYLPYLLDQLRTLATGAPAVVTLGAVGFVANRYRADRRALVTFAGLAGLAFVVGMPLANFLPVPWSAVHATAMLSVPAAVGGASLVRRVRRAVDVGANAQAAVVSVLVLAVVGAAVTTAVGTSYVAPHESPKGDPGSEVVYYSQPPAKLGTLLPAFREAAGTPGPDLLYYGHPLALDDERAADHPPPPGRWLGRLPLPWYTERFGLQTASATRPGALSDAPPIVVTSPANRTTVANRLDGYEATTVPLDDLRARSVVVFVDRDLEGATTNRQ